jgi:hypothetical protein
VPFPVVPVKISFAVVDPEASRAGNVELLSHASYFGAVESAVENAILNTFAAAFAWPDPMAFDGIAMCYLLFVFGILSYF